MSVQFVPSVNQPHQPNETSSSISGQTEQLRGLFKAIEELSSRAKYFAFRMYGSSPSIKTFHDVVTLRTKSETGLDVDQIRSSRETVKEIEMVVIREVSKQFLSPEHKIVEIGAGQLDQDGYSYLTKRLPHELRGAVEPTEVNRALIIPSDKKLKRVDTLELDKSYPAESLDRIISSAVLDTLNEQDLIRTLQQAHAVLKKNGLFIHVSTLCPFRDTLVSTYTNDQTVYFPWIDQENRFLGLQVISKEALIKFLDTAQHASEYSVNFLRKYADLPATHRECITADLPATHRECITNELIMNVKVERLIFSNWISEMKPEGLTCIDNISFFEERAKKSLEMTGFKIIEFGYREKSHIIKRPKNFPGSKKFHHFSLAPEKHITEASQALKEKGQIFQQVKMQVFVAEKISANQKA